MSRYPFEQYSIRTTGIYASTFKLGLLPTSQHWFFLTYCVHMWGFDFFFFFFPMGRAEREKNLQLLYCKTQESSRYTKGKGNIFLKSLGVKAELEATQR